MLSILAPLKYPWVWVVLFVAGVFIYATNRPDVVLAIACFVLMVFYAPLISAMRAGEMTAAVTMPLCGLTAYSVAVYGVPLSPYMWTTVLFTFGCLALLYEFVFDVLHLANKIIGREPAEWTEREGIPTFITFARLLATALSISLPALVTGLAVSGQ